MSRLPPLPRLDWRDADTPFSTDLEDVYFSGDGLSEKRAVFLGGCRLLEAWAGRAHFAIGETGFGTGLNFLAAWDLWRRHRPSPAARLSFLSFEGALLSRSDAARIHKAWPELADLSAALLSCWPTRARSVQRIHFSDGVSLTLHIDDIAAALPEADAVIDAWFLDGFAPAKNPAMWNPDVFSNIARLSAPGARAATYTVAGDVRRGLEVAGFTVAKVQGHGRKKERLEAWLATPSTKSTRSGALVKTGASATREPSPRILIVGAGIAGAATARAFLDRNARVTVLDAGLAPGSGASGNPVALVMPRLDAADGPTARGLIDAYLLARRAYLALGSNAAIPLDVRHLPRNDAERARFIRLLSDPPLDDDMLGPLDPADPGAGLIHRGAVAVHPACALPALLTGADLRFGAAIAAIASDETGATVTLADGERISADLVVVCTAMGALRIDGLVSPDLDPRLGQIEHSGTGSSSARATADGGYVVDAFGGLVFGATFEPATTADPIPTTAARAYNRDILRRLRPDLNPAAIETTLTSRAAIRAATQDRLPFAGPPPGARIPENEKAPEEHPAPSGAIRLIGGLGSRGFLWAPLLAELVASSAFGEPSPAERSVVSALDPDRFRQRALRRRG